jgi:bifunctional oligoribonuclease and PAP phosphatase NrnA
MYNLSPNIVKLNGYILQNYVTGAHGVAHIKLTKDLLQQFGAKPSEASLLVGALGNIKGIIAWVFFIEEKDQIRVRFRSKGPVINTIARNYNGGGHPLAAGASIYAWDTSDDVVHQVEELCADYHTNKQ